MGDNDAPVGCFTVSWWTGGAVVTTGYCSLVSRVVWVIPMLRHLLNLQAWHFFLLVGVIWHVRASPRDLQLNVSNLFPTWDKSLEMCSLISTKISPKICGRKLCKRSMKWWSTNCSGTVKNISVNIRRNIFSVVVGHLGGSVSTHRALSSHATSAWSSPSMLVNTDQLVTNLNIINPWSTVKYFSTTWISNIFWAMRLSWTFADRCPS